jgi:hypothetical protein
MDMDFCPKCSGIVALLGTYKMEEFEESAIGTPAPLLVDAWICTVCGFMELKGHSKAEVESLLQHEAWFVPDILKEAGKPLTLDQIRGEVIKRGGVEQPASATSLGHSFADLQNRLDQQDKIYKTDIKGTTYYSMEPIDHFTEMLRRNKTTPPG